MDHVETLAKQTEALTLQKPIDKEKNVERTDKGKDVKTKWSTGSLAPSDGKRAKPDAGKGDDSKILKRPIAAVDGDDSDVMGSDEGSPTLSGSDTSVADDEKPSPSPSPQPVHPAKLHRGKPLTEEVVSSVDWRSRGNCYSRCLTEDEKEEMRRSSGASSCTSSNK